MHSSLIWRGALAWNLLNLAVRINRVFLKSTRGAYGFCHQPGAVAHPSAWQRAIPVVRQKCYGSSPAAFRATGYGPLDRYTFLLPSSRSTASTAVWLLDAEGSPGRRYYHRVPLYGPSWIWRL